LEGLHGFADRPAADLEAVSQLQLGRHPLAGPKAPVHDLALEGVDDALDEADPAQPMEGLGAGDRPGGYRHPP
jgi:hypothetical protein